MILDKLTELREMIDDFYELGPRKRVESDAYLQIDNKINEIKGLVMSAIVKGEIGDEHV